MLLLLSDSTNVEHDGLDGFGAQRARRPGAASSQSAAGKIFFSTFSSHVHRLQQVLELSEATGRRVVIVGRSLVNSIRIATDLGYLRAPPSLFADIVELATLPPQQVTVLTSGSQGEPLSALTRIAMGDHAQVQHGARRRGDPVVAHHPRQRAHRSAT